MANELLHGLLSLSLTLGAVIVLTCAMRLPLRRAFGARLAYWAWSTVPVTLAMAALPATRVPASVQQLVVPFQHLTSTGTTLVQRSGEQWLLWSIVIWLTGCLTMLTWFRFAHVRYRRRLGPLRLQNGYFYSSSTSEGPAVIGLFRASIVLPANFTERYTLQEQRLILAHEAVHVQRRDPLANSLCALLQCLFWFHPLVHWAARHFRLDQELACDAAVMHANPDQRRIYAEAMLKTQMSAQSTLIHCHWQSTHPLKERIMQLRQTPPNKCRGLFGRLSVAALIISCGYGTVAAHAAGAQLAQEGKYFINMRLIANGESSAPKLQVQEGVPFGVASQGSGGVWRTEGVLNKTGGTSVFLKAVIKHDDRVISSPGLLVEVGKPATVAVKGGSPDDDFELQLTVTAIK